MHPGPNGVVLGGNGGCPKRSRIQGRDGPFLEIGRFESSFFTLSRKAVLRSVALGSPSCDHEQVSRARATSRHRIGLACRAFARSANFWLLFCRAQLTVATVNYRKKEQISQVQRLRVSLDFGTGLSPAGAVCTDAR